MPRAPLTEEQKNALIERLKKAREAKLAEEENKVAEKKAKTEKKSKPKEVEEKSVEVAPKVEATPVHREPVVAARVAPIEPPVHKTPHKPSPVTKPAKEKYAKVVFYKEPSSKKLKKMQSVLGSSSDEDEAEEKVVKSKAAVAQPVVVPKVDPNEQRKLQYQKLSNLAHHFFDN